MSRFLKANERCPVHQSYFCTPCHKPKKQLERKKFPPRSVPCHPARYGAHIQGEEFRPSPRRAPRFEPAVQVVPDPFHPRGYREICNDRERRRRKQAHIMAQEGCCYLCTERFDDYSLIDFCHKRSRGMGGAWRDDSMENTFAAHRACNCEQGSKEVA